MEIDYKLNFIQFLSYFILVGALLWKISPQLKKSFNQHSPDINVFFALTTISLLVTWTYFFKFLALNYTTWSFSKGFHWEFSLNAVSHWLHDTSLFEVFSKQISAGTLQWLWTHQLGTFTVAAWTSILAIEGWRRSIPHLWAYSLLGELMGISSASGLFFAVMSSHPPIKRRPSSKLLFTLAISVLIGLVSVSLFPSLSTSDGRLLPNVMIIQIVQTLPLLFDFHESKATTIQDDSPKWITLFYSLVAGANISIYVQECSKALLTFDQIEDVFNIFSVLWNNFFEHPAQTVINLDVIWVNIISAVWMLSHCQAVWKKHVPNWIWLCIYLTPFLSASITLPIFLASCEATKLIVDHKKLE